MRTIRKQRLGSASSSRQMSLLLEPLTRETSGTLLLPILPDTNNVISSPVSVDGATRLDWQDGRTHALYGPDRAHASLSPRQAKEKGLLTSGTFGQPSFTLSSTLALQSSLESRLRHRLGSSGSALFKLIWKQQVIPSGLPICRLRASGRRTSDKDSSGWPSPLVNDAKGSNYTYNQGNHDSISLKLGGVAQLTSPWATPAARDFHSESATDAFNEKRWASSRGKPLSAQATLSTWISPQAADANGSGLNQHTASLCKQARTLTGWPTPTSSLADKGVRSMEGGIAEAMRNHGPDLGAVSCLAGWATPVSTEIGNTLENYRAMKQNMKSGPRTAVTHPSLQAQLAVWPSPKANNHTGAGTRGEGGENLQTAAAFSTWPTPTAVDYKGSNPLSRPQGDDDLPTRALRVASGTIASGSPVQTERQGQLNPAFSRWLQGYPAVWDVCAIRAHRLTPTTRRKRAP